MDNTNTIEKRRHVMVVPTNALFPGDAPQGFITTDTTALIERIYEHYLFVPRYLVEEDPSLKQIIPYAVVTYNGSIFLLRRFAVQDEKRLADKFSIGVGGHINPLPFMNTGIIEKGLRREINEEISIPGGYNATVMGFINDDSNPVGQVHLGIVYHVETANPRVEVREIELMAGGFRSATEVLKYRPRMETWSQMLAGNIDLFVAERRKSA